MKHRHAAAAVLTVLVGAVSVSAAALSACGGQADAPPVSTPAPAEATVKALVFSYGVGARNVLDSARGTFTKDMIAAPAVTVPLVLSERQMARVSAKIDAIGFFSYPSVYETPGDDALAEPHSPYRFAVTTASGTKVVAWEDAVRNDEERAAGLRQLARLLERMIMATREYKRLPEPEGGYL
jgi:hypothetical protein